jgi:hypothetical protein
MSAIGIVFDKEFSDERISRKVSSSKIGCWCRRGGDTEVPVAPLRVARRICTTVQRLNPIAHVFIAISPKEQKKRGDRRHDLPVSRKQGVAFRFRCSVMTRSP